MCFIYFLASCAFIDVYSQEVDTLCYQGDYALKYRYIQYANTEKVSQAIFQISQLDSVMFDSLQYSFQVRNDGTLSNIDISGDLSSYKVSELEESLKRVIFFKPINSSQIVFATYLLKGKKSNPNKVKDLSNGTKNYVSVEAVPIGEAAIKEIEQRVRKELHQFYLTSPQEQKVFMKLTIERGRVKQLSIIKGANPTIDQVVVKTVRAMFSENPRLIHYQNKSIDITFPVTTASIYSDRLILPYKLIKSPNYRVKKIKYYDGRNMSGKLTFEYINDSRLIKSSELIYEYKDNLVNTIKKVVYDKENSRSSVDSIFYHSIDSVSRFKEDGTLYSRQKLFNYFFHVRQLASRKRLVLKRGSEVYEFQKNKERLVKSNRTKTIDNPFEKRREKNSYEYKYDSIGRVSSISIKKNENYRYQYTDTGYKRSWVSEGWSDSDTYFFNEAGYLIAKIDQSDTQPFITVYEYEQGKGNASFFENDYHDLIVLNPVIY